MNCRLALIGNPVSHSASPSIFDSLFKARGINGSYELMELSQDQLPQMREIVKSNNLNGFNVTMPYKRAIIPFLDDISRVASIAHSVNTVIVTGSGGLHGFSTDGGGALAALYAQNVPVASKRVLIYGAGAAAASIALNLTRQNAHCFVCARRAEAADELSAQIVGVSPMHSFSLKGVDILINASPLGMDSCGEFEYLNELEEMKRGAAVFDITYRRVSTETALIRRSRELGLTTLDGRSLVLEQAKLAFKLFLGEDYEE